MKSKYLVISSEEGDLDGLRIQEVECEGGIDQAVFDYFKAILIEDGEHGRKVTKKQVSEFIDGLEVSSSDPDQRVFEWCDTMFNFSRVDDIIVS